MADSVHVEPSQPTRREGGSVLDVQCDTRVACTARCACPAAVESCSVEPAKRVDVCHATLCDCVCVCVYEREGTGRDEGEGEKREREKGRGRQREREREIERATSRDGEGGREGGGGKLRPSGRLLLPCRACKQLAARWEKGGWLGWGLLEKGACGRGRGAGSAAPPSGLQHAGVTCVRESCCR